MSDSVVPDREIPEADRLEQDAPVGDADTPEPAGPLTRSWDADDVDRLEQSIEIPDDEEHDYDG